MQLYEPYNEPEAAAKALGLNAHTNLNNPTGIFANNDDILYVMVESEIEEGSSLYLTYHIGHGELSGYANGFELHQGLNVIPVYNNETNFCINYVVHTFDTSDGKKGNKAKARKLSDYKPIKIHIEGGYINGYWNKMGDELYTADTNDSWEYIEARATQKTVTVLGKYITLQFPLLDENTVTNDDVQRKGLASYFNELVNIEDCINEWDNVMLWERLLLGIMDAKTIENEAKESPYSDKATVFEYTGNDGEFESDYSDYYNVHGLSYGIPNSYMYGGWAHCGYNYSTMDGVIRDLPTSAGAHWGPGHEIGHQHQGLLNMRGLTEVTNNLFANVVLWYFGETTSRYNGDNGALSNVLAQFNAEGTDFFSNNIWAQTIMYYKLFLYYHVLGHNPKFYPHLFEMLRQDLMTIEYYQDGSKCLMHFYKKCCEAAGEDLTEFFRAHGFFEVMDNRFVGDYSNAEYTLTQVQIDDAIAEVKAQAKAKGWKENIAVLFINDATGETIKSHKGDNLEKYGETTVCAEMGSYSNFNSEPSNYTYSISGSTVTMEGEGGVGFAILNEKGELIGFSDKKTFEISAEAAAVIASGKASIVTLKGDNTQVATTNVMDAGDNETKYELLGNLLDDAKALLDLSDETGTKVGYYRTSALTDLQTAYTTAKGVYDEKTVVAYSAVYDVLYQEYADLLNNDYARINITEGYAYRLTNKAYADRSMAVNTENNQMSGIATAESDAQLWYFEPGATKGTYYLKNKKTQKYPGDVSTSAVLSANKSEADKGKDNGAYAYNLQSMGNGIFALVGSTGLHCSSSQSYNIVGWGADADASQWTITAVALDDAIEARTKLEEVMSKTEALIAEMADVQMKGYALDMSTCTITSNATEKGHETQYLVDGDPNTFFHTNWTGTAINENHNIVIDLGEGNNLEQFVLNYTTLPSSSNNVDAPQEIQIYGSNNGSAYTWLGGLTELPNTKGATYTSPTKGTVGTPYRYIRLDVTTATGGKLGSYYYFGIAELGLTNMQPIVHSVLPEYTGARTTIIDACDELYNATLIYDNNSATVNDLSNATLALSEKYEALLTAYNTPKNAALDAKKQELQALIATAKELIDVCGSATYTPATYDGAADLQTTNASGNFYVSTNADQNTGGGKVDGGGIAALVDNNYNTYFHTRWEGTKVNEPHYFQVDLGEGLKYEEFSFSYKPRENSPAPTSMIVSGSNDGSQFNTLTTITSGLPSHTSGKTYQSASITSSYRYLRFTVTGSQGPGENKYNNQYFFGMLEFDLMLIGGPESYTAEVDDNMGDVTPEMLIETLKETQEAEMSIAYATTEAQLDRASANLQAKIDQLEEAKKGEKSLKKQQLADLISTATALRNACGSVADNGDVTLNDPDPQYAGSVNKNMLRALNSEIANAQGVHDNATSTLDNYTDAITALQNQMDVVTEAKGSPAKADLKTAIEAAQTAINACASSITKDGDEYTVVWIFETAGDVDKATLIAAYEALAQANTVYNGQASTIDAYKAAKEALGTPITTLNEYQQGLYKAQLKSMVDLLTALIEKCNTDEGQGDLTTGMLEEMVQLNETATAYLTQEFATQEDLVSTIEGAISNIETNYSTWTAAQQSTAKAELRKMIADLAELIDECGTVTEEGSEYIATLDPYAGVVTEEQLIAAYTANLEAEALANNSADATQLTEKKEELQGIYNSLLTAKNTNWLPVTLTKDINNPVLYTFKSKRSSNETVKHLQYDPADTHSFSIATAADGSAKQAFFFMMGDTRNQVYIYPYAGAGMVLGANNTDNGANKVFAGEKGTQAYKQWTFTERTVNDATWYDLKPVGQNTYFSNYGGGSNNMGFYSTADDGSGFQFVQVKIEGSSAYNSLKLYYEEAGKGFGSKELLGSSQVGYYSTEDAARYNAASAVVTEMLANSSTTDDASYLAQYAAFRELNESLRMNLPDEEKYYVIQSVVKDNGSALAYAQPADNKMYWGAGKTAVNAEAIWQFTDNGDGTYTVTNLHTGTMVNGFISNKPTPLSTSAGKISFTSLSHDGQVGIRASNGTMMHAQSGGEVVHWETTKNDASAWRIQEVDVANVVFTATIGSSGYAGLHLNYPVVIPDDFEAYYVDSTTESVAKLSRIEGVIPANEGVLLKGEVKASCLLKYSTNPGPDISGSNILKGANYTSYLPGEDGWKYFLFGVKNNVAGFYWSYLNYNANGTIVDSTNGGYNDAGGYFRCTANKIYLPIKNTNAASFTLRFNNPTVIEDLLNGLNNEEVIYDIQGRRITKVTESGIYIVNGQKRYIHVK